MTALAMAPATSTPLHDEVVTMSARGRARRVLWGESWHLGSAAFWVARCQNAVPAEYVYAFGNTLAEEVAACILGGHGIPAEVGLAAYVRLRAQGFFDADARPSGHDLEAALRVPLNVAGRTVHYRFAAQRGQRLGAALRMLHEDDERPTDAVALRDWLLRLPGVGLKTASWVVRNHLGSDRVAIIDVHLLRAGVIAGIYDPAWTPAKDYPLLEDLFLSWADHGRVSAAALDAIIWAEMASLGRSVYSALGVPDDRPSWYALDY
jgi:thermostable 8-oxoguanine DNA glycosylase